MKRKGWDSGVTLIELMVASSILSICILSLLSTFAGLQKGIQNSKGKTLASNLAQEQMQILKQKSYHQVLITPTAATTSGYGPTITYDSTYFPPESIREGGIAYKRFTYVQVAQEVSASIQTLSPTTPDTGMKQITVTVGWFQGSEAKQLSIKSILGNPDTTMSNAIFSGTITNAADLNPLTNPINGALVNLAENMGWRDTSDSSGKYNINLSPGNFTMAVSAQGYFPQLRIVSIGAQESQTQDFALQPMSSGTVRGIAWYDPKLLISQVVPHLAQPDGFDAQFIELFNPTTAAINVGTDITSHEIRLNLTSTCFNPRACEDVDLIYISTYVPSGQYYLIANTATFVNGAITYTADAYYTDTANPGCTSPPPATDWNISIIPPLKRILQPSHNGSVWISDSSGILDAVAWIHSVSSVPTIWEGNYVNLTPNGLGGADAQQLVRTSSPAFTSDLYGRAYDYGNNRLDFSTAPSVSYAIYSTTAALAINQTSWTVISGIPAIGAVISANDGLSSSTAAYAVGSPPRAEFTLLNVATGTWTVFISSNEYLLENTTVTITATGDVYTFPSSTTMLTQTNDQGFISGRVTNALGGSISPMTVSPGSAGSDANADTSTNGRYLLRVATGYVNVTANPSNANPNYVYISSESILVSLGRITSGVDFILTQGGQISGFVTRDGINALPGIAVAVLDSNGVSHDEQVSDVAGRFTTVTIATGAYTVQPVLDSLETSVPNSVVTVASAGITTFSSTFTITGALGTITGKVCTGGGSSCTSSSPTVPTGILIVVTTSTLAGSPPAPPDLSSRTLTSAAIYITSSKEDGTYSVDVRQSTNPVYRVYGYYTTPTDTGATVQTPSETPTVGVTAGQVVGTSVDLAFP